MLKQWVVWLISAALAIAVYAVANQAGLSNTQVLVLTFVGALVGAIVGNFILQGRQTRD
jgi:hypothetical protein